MPIPKTYVDTHFHLEPEDDLDAMVAAAREAGVVWMLVAGAPVGQMATVLERIDPHPMVYAAAGVHPHEADQFDGDMALYERLAEHPRVKAIGEIGLDYHYDFSDRARQRQVLAQFLALAAKTGKPAILHTREADADVYRLLQEHLPPGHPFVVHCFTGTVEWARRYVELGGWLSFTGILTFPKAENVRDAMRAVPLDRLMFETDSPYLAPKPFRGKRNQPAFVVHTVAHAAETLGLPAEELATLTTANAGRFFGVA